MENEAILVFHTPFNIEKDLKRIDSLFTCIFLLIINVFNIYDSMNFKFNKIYNML